MSKTKMFFLGFASAYDFTGSGFDGVRRELSSRQTKGKYIDKYITNRKETLTKLNENTKKQSATA